MAGEVAFTLTEADYLAANRDWFVRAIRRPRALARIAGILAFTALVGFLVSLIVDRSSVYEAAMVAIGLSFFALAGMPVVYAACYVMLPRQARRVYRQQKSLSQPCRYVWSEEGLDFFSPSGTFKIAWRDLYRWIKGPRAFLFLISERAFFTVPRRVLTAEQTEDLHALAARLGPPRL